MIIAMMRNAASAVPLKVAQTVKIYFVTTVPINVTAGMNLSVKFALQGILNVNTMGAKGYTVMTVVKQNNTIWNIVTSVRIHTALNGDT